MTIDYGAFSEIMEMISLGMEVPGLKGADPDKIPELLHKAKDLAGQKNIDNGGGKFRKGRVVNCKKCGLNFEMKDNKGNEE